MNHSVISERTLNMAGLFSLAFGSFLIIAYATIAYFAIWRGELLPIMPGSRRLSEQNPYAFVLSPFSIIILLSGIGFVLNGYILLKYVRHKELRKTKSATVLSILTDDEKKAYSALEESDGNITQKNLSEILGFSPVKTHRVIARLEQKNLVKSYEFGMTKKIILNNTETYPKR